MDGAGYGRPGSRRMRSVLIAAGLAGLVGSTVPLFLQQNAASQFTAQTQLKVEAASESVVSSNLAKLRSKANLDNLIRALNLSNDSKFAVDRSGFVQVLYDIVSGGGMTMAETEAGLRKRLSDAITLDYDKTHGTVSIAVTAGEADEATRLATLLARALADGISVAVQGQPDAAVDGLRQAMERAEAALSGFLSQTDAGRLADLRRVHTERQTLLTEATEAQSELVQLREKVQQALAMKLADVLGKPLPDSLEFTGLEYRRQRYVEAQLAVDQLSSSLGPRHPRLLAAQGALEDIRRDIQQALKQLVTSLQRDEASAAKRVSELKARQSAPGDKQAFDAAERLAVLETAVNEARENYLAGQQRRPSAVTKPATAKVQVLKPASAKPVEPDRLALLMQCAAGGATGFLSGLALMWIGRRRAEEPQAVSYESIVLSQAVPLEASPLADDDWADLDLTDYEEPAQPLMAAANDHSWPEDGTPLADHIRDLLMANRRPVAEAQLPPLVAAVMARGSSSVESGHSYRHQARPVPQQGQDLLALRQEMAELREKVEHYSGRRQASRR